MFIRPLFPMPLFTGRSAGWFSLLLGCLLGGITAQARVLTITDTNDTTRLTSLRGAIIAACQEGGYNIIVLGEPAPKQRISPAQISYRLTLPGADEAQGLTGDLDITRGNLVIMGASSNVVIDATGLGDRVFRVFPKAQLTLVNLRITGGTAPGNGSAYHANGESGGAIYNAGTLTLYGCVLTGNSGGGGNFPEGNAGGTGGGDGGAVYNSGVLQMMNCIIAGNFAGAGADGAFGGNGGGLKNDGNCQLTECVIGGNQSGAGGGPAGNFAGFGGGGGNGGGIYNSASLILDACVVSNNLAGNGSNGGDPEIAWVGSPGGSGGPGGSGAGIYNTGQLELYFSTVNDNSAGSGGNGGSFGAGGGAGTGGSGAGVFNSGKL